MGLRLNEDVRTLLGCSTIRCWTIGAGPLGPGACRRPGRTGIRINRARACLTTRKNPSPGRGGRTDGRRRRCHRRSWTGHRASARPSKEQPDAGNLPGAAHRTGAGRAGTSHGVANLGAHHSGTIPLRRSLRCRRCRWRSRETGEVYQPIVRVGGSTNRLRRVVSGAGEAGDRTPHIGTHRRGTADHLADERDPGRMTGSRTTSSRRETPNARPLPPGYAHPLPRVLWTGARRRPQPAQEQAS
jgi:hypothetical protein